jgi:hypothetical protein
LHPIVLAINQIGMDLTVALDRIWDTCPDDLSAVEYLPLISNKMFFHKPHKRAMEVLSKMIQEAYQAEKDHSSHAK